MGGGTLHCWGGGARALVRSEHLTEEDVKRITVKEEEHFVTVEDVEQITVKEGEHFTD